jgi:hypothetical protein
MILMCASLYFNVPEMNDFQGMPVLHSYIIIMEKELNFCHRLVVIIDIDYSLRRTDSSSGILWE